MNNLKNKIEELKSDPGKIFGLLYPYILIVIMTMGLYYVTHLGNVARQTIPPVPPDTTKQVDLPVVEPRTIPPINIMEISKPTPELISQGKELFTTICQSCHGEDGKGDGPASAGLNPKPRNFTSKEGWKNSPKISGIFTTLSEGIPGSGMVAYDYLPPSDRIALAHYIRDSFVPSPPADNEGELTALDQTYSLSQGKEVPAQIPVKYAVDIIIKENDSVIQNLLQKVSQVSSSNESGAKLFNEVTTDKARALTTLNYDKNWKQDYTKFRNAIVYNVSTNGFNNNIFKLSSDEWNTLYSYMNRLF
jgi:mono/diheme cytochrome c family protein